MKNEIKNNQMSILYTQKGNWHQWKIIPSYSGQQVLNIPLLNSILRQQNRVKVFPLYYSPYYSKRKNNTKHFSNSSFKENRKKWFLLICSIIIAVSTFFYIMNVTQLLRELEYQNSRKEEFYKLLDYRNYNSIFYLQEDSEDDEKE